MDAFDGATLTAADSGSSQPCTPITTVSELASRWSWRAIPNCLGRFVLSSGPSPVPPAELVAAGVKITEHVVTAARNPVVVARLRDGGLISYRKPDGTYLHTLNTREGFERKLQQLGIAANTPDEASSPALAHGFAPRD